MSVQVDQGWIVSDRSEHRAKSVGEGGWVVSFLPGRTLTKEQAITAIQIAEMAAATEELAQRVGLTAIEAVGLAVIEPPWGLPERATSRWEFRFASALRSRPWREHSPAQRT
ncbi:hypothetical protein NDR87_14060 [Nocardia sp. CDC159]|uniref:Uncharacterized protein n=1 Tax=Nocardia pulmonis TaxID=2951408 RepID=A0A9X2E5E8_9NOCA|nr:MULTISPECIES: hypothetical protein [Nocardia]MCM6774452.1 hypothetical protein [Nocardia pulmonis]MCM6787482.1 hypothetical protein [Nocardia sp. CDC159]